ncbi:MAG: copper chaperone PCu(A)C [Proteobacteria bacterium]|nr:copper chaperone PCu(A)C [Pseudomonadota bacterium]
MTFDPWSLARALAFLLMATNLNQAIAENHEQAGISLEAAWARPTPPTARNGVVYLTIKNDGHQRDQLIKAQASLAARTGLHTHIMADGIARMRPLDAIDVPKGSTTTLKPGANHIMLFGLKSPLKEGDSFPLTLTFKNAGPKIVTVTIGKIGPQSGHGAPHSNMKHHKDM